MHILRRIVHPSERTCLELLAGWFVITRFAFVAAGGRFDAATDWFIQLADTQLLRSRLVDTLVHFHAQPPAFNLLRGVVLHMGDRWHQGAYEAVFRLLGLLLCFSAYSLLRSLRTPRVAALVATGVIVASPPVLLYENWLFYPYPVGVLLVAGSAAFARFAASRAIGRGLSAFGAFALVVLTRATYHVAWLFLPLVLLRRVSPRLRCSPILRAAVVPLTLVAAVCAKNVVLFGQFSGSSWLGMNLWRVAVEPLPVEERRGLVERGTLSKVSLVAPFSPIEDYPDDMRAMDPRMTAPALTATRRSDGRVNLNHAAYLAISRQYLRDSVAVIRASPRRYLASVAFAFRLFALPTTEVALLSGHNRESIQPWIDLWDRYALGAVNRWTAAPTSFDVPTIFDPGPRGARYLAVHGTYVFMGLLLLCSVGLGGPALLALIRGRGRPEDATFAMVVMTIAMVMLASCMFERGENNRFRFEVEPLSYLLVFVGGRRALTHLRPLALRVAARVLNRS